VLENTLVPPSEPNGERDATTATVKVCRTCGSRFSGDARFCPFDAEPLTVTLDVTPRDPLLGTVVDDRYEIEAVLGEGGMGTVYRARHRVLDKKLAMKVLRADLSRDADLGVRFLREAKAAASIAHPSVVQITDFGNLPSGQPYFVMELLVGASLSAILRKGGPLPAARAVRLLLQMVDALGAAHEAGVVHRDLKPDNILICPVQGGETVKVLDFGLAKVAGQSRLTKAGLVFGTPHYMSPEQASGGTVDERTDLYALGIVMYEMFTGRVPFEADTYMGVLTKHIYVAPTPPSVLLGGVGELGALEQVTLRCLEKKPERRYASMRALADELSRVARFNDTGALTVKPMELGEPRGPRLADELELPTVEELKLSLALAGVPKTPLPTWLVPVAAAAALLALGAALFLLRSPKVPPRPRLGPTDSASAATTVERPRSVAEHAPAREPQPQVTPISADPGNLPLSSARTRSGRPAQGNRPLPAHSEAKPSTPKGKMVGNEIVDPWSK
jgi:serine/threonine protein kinase